MPNCPWFRKCAWPTTLPLFYDIKKFFANNLFRFIPYCKSFPFSMSMLILRTLKWNNDEILIYPACCHKSTSISFLMIGRCSLTCLCRKSWAVKKQQCSLLICRATADGHLAGGGGCLVARRTWAATRYHLKPCSSDSSGQASGSQSWNTAAFTLY